MKTEFWQEVEALLKPIPQIDLEYRVYYNADGDITSCSMQQHGDGDYVVVTKDIYDAYFDYKIVKGQAQKIDRTARYSVQLRKSNRGFPVVRGHASIIVEDEVYKDIEYYEPRIN